MRRFAFALFMVTLAGCGYSSQPRIAPAVPIVTPPIELTSAQIKVVQGAVINSLKDPGSAQFGEIKAVKNEGTSNELVLACGWVNAKNSFGGYVGSSPFMVLYSKHLNKADVIKMGGNEMVNFQIQNRCLEKGIRL